MSEQPTPIVSLDDYREGSRFDSDTHVDLKKSNLPYDPDALARIHQNEAARLAREAAAKTEREMSKSGPEQALGRLSSLTAERNAVVEGQFGIAA